MKRIMYLCSHQILKPTFIMLTNQQCVRVLLCVLLCMLAATTNMYAKTKTQQKGKASYYSRRTNGHRTSSGERMNNDSLVCAHRTHPFGTKLLVRNPANGKEVVVRVIDRGPFTRGRIIDLSYEAARRIGMLSAGVAMVEVSVYDDTPVPFKPKDISSTVPELELEMNDGGNAMNPAWKRLHEQKEAEKAHASKNTEKGESHAGKAAQKAAAKTEKKTTADKATQNKNTEKVESHTVKATPKAAAKTEKKIRGNKATQNKETKQTASDR